MGQEADWVGITVMLVEGPQGRGARNQDVAATISPDQPGAPGDFDQHPSLTSPE